ncbi:MAG: peptidoglycan DD-metalloendopeptidase family protein [Acidimicrobiia bacterium]|nr:peptidoglycan DD-metalloendopeptidase family protein [Acidimicrobiia bacterium]NNF70280.1 peptidoglycan DD-metalloendopeptidase family protein [Acidimicrobiia bacterium]
MRRRLIVAVLTLLTIGGVIPAAHASLESDLESVQDAIEDIQDRISEAEGRQSDLVTDLLISQSRIDGLDADIRVTVTELAVVTADIATTESELDLLEGQLAAQNSALEATREEMATTNAEALSFALEAYMGAGPTGLEFAMVVDEVQDIGLAVDYVGWLALATERDLRRLDALAQLEGRQRVLIEQQQLVVGELLSLLEQDGARLVGLRTRLEDQRVQVEDELVTQQARLDELEEQEAEFRDELDVLEAEQANIEELIAERARQAGSAPGILMRPVPGPISSGFGPRLHPILGYTRMHTGADMSAGQGDPIVAGADGVVILAAYNGGYGNTVMIDHGGGMVTLYAHQSSLAVVYGQTVATGDLIGYIGSTGLSTGPHLHFEVRINGEPVDPAQYL